jgi:MFS family permease
MTDGVLSGLEKRRTRTVGYILTFLSTFSLGITEIFAPWYAGVLGATQFEIGWAMGSYGIVYMFSPIIGGKISDRIGRRKSLIGAIIAYLGILALYPQPFIIPIHLILIRALEGFFFGLIYPTISAMVSELAPESQGAVLGNFASAWSAGMVMSPFVIAYMAVNYGNVTSIYIVIAVELLALALVGGTVRDYVLEEVLSDDEKDQLSAITDNDVPGDVRTSRRFIGASLALMLFGFVSTVLLGLFPTYIERLPGFTTEDFGNLLLVWNLSRTIGFLICTRLPHPEMGNVMLIGTFLLAVSMPILAFIVDFWLFAIAMVMSGFGVGFNYLGGLYTVVSATEKEKGAFAGIGESLAGIGFFLGPIVGGWFADFTITWPYLLCMILSIVILITNIPLLRDYKKKHG